MGTLTLYRGVVRALLLGGDRDLDFDLRAGDRDLRLGDRDLFLEDREVESFSRSPSFLFSRSLSLPWSLSALSGLALRGGDLEIIVS